METHTWQNFTQFSVNRLINNVFICNWFTLNTSMQQYLFLIFRFGFFNAVLMLNCKCNFIRFHLILKYLIMHKNQLFLQIYLNEKSDYFNNIKLNLFINILTRGRNSKYCRRIFFNFSGKVIVNYVDIKPEYYRKITFMVSSF